MNQQDPKIQEIVLRVKNGDHLAFRELFDMFYPEMVKSAMLMLKEQELAKEAAQDAFVSIWRNHATLDTSKSIRAYIKTATISRALNLIKSRKHHRNAGEEPLIYQEDKKPTPLRVVEQNELGEIIRQAVDALPDRCREAFVLAKYEGRSYKEIGAMMDITPKTVENQVARAIKALRVSLGPYYKSIILFSVLVREYLFANV